ncbi:MAG TPA: PP2C family serine/threonine-protein phosphatase [Polyangia bacterium]|nr:PP2C family serine/threonine-protein phosphatase [Polyangia bacterium]
MSSNPSSEAGVSDSGIPHRTLTVCGGTNVGTTRKKNQDTFVIAELESGRVSRPCLRTDITVSRPGLLMVVCDGMGGAAAGEVASRLAAKSIKQHLQTEGTRAREAPGESLERAVLNANDAVLGEARAHPEEKGMGTTCTAAILAPERLAVAQVGDSRAYLLRDGRLRALTRDQTLAAQLVEAGALKPEEVKRFPYRNVLSQALGTKGTVDPVITDEELREGDRVLLCSDGLHGSVSDEAIAKILGSAGDVAAASEELIAAALSAGGPDDITVIVAECGPMERSQLSPPAT